MKIILLIIIIVLVHSCISGQGQETKLMLKKWQGKEIVFPRLLTKFYSGDSIRCNYQEQQGKYKILVYIDTVGCVSCKLKLHEWQALIKKAYSEFGDKLAFEFFFFPPEGFNIRTFIKIYDFNHPIYVDNADSLNKLNHFPQKKDFQCFLLDTNNRVLLMGNPNRDPQIWQLYRQIINKDFKIPVIKTTKIQFEKPIIELKKLPVNDTIYVQATIKNIGRHPLILKNIYTDCDCVVPNWSTNPIMPGKESNIAIKIIAKNTGYLYKKISILCNTENKVEQLIIKGFIQ